MSRDYDLVVVGLGSGGIVAATFGARLGLKVAAVERDRVGGDCLWTGCVPSKALIASARTAHALRNADHVGLEPVEPAIDLASVWRRMRAVQERIAQTDDDPERLRAIGIDIITGGVTAVELAQACRRLGVEVALLEQAPTMLAREEPRLVRTLTGKLIEEGIEVRTGVDVAHVSSEGRRKLLRLPAADGGNGAVAADEILVAIGRERNVARLGLEEAGVATSAHRIEVDSRLRTSLPSVYAAGDVAGRFAFTHSAAHEAAQACATCSSWDAPGRSRSCTSTRRCRPRSRRWRPRSPTTAPGATCG